MRFDRLTPKEKEYLRAMAHLDPVPHRSGDVAGCLGVRIESVPGAFIVVVTGHDLQREGPWQHRVHRAGRRGIS